MKSFKYELPSLVPPTDSPDFEKAKYTKVPLRFLVQAIAIGSIADLETIEPETPVALGVSRTVPMGSKLAKGA